MRLPSALAVRSAALFCLACNNPAAAVTSAELQARDPQYFDAVTGYRIERYRAPTPDGVPGAVRIDARTVKAMIDAGAVAIDVSVDMKGQLDRDDGTWFLAEPRMTLPGAIWLPEVGRGVIDALIAGYLERQLARLAFENRDRPLIFFCIADCWMSWNAAQRAAALGFREVFWFAEGTDGWLDEGFGLAPAFPPDIDLPDHGPPQ
ncbi:MAG: PQQ-dependent catabolism-associated CXXCW motif protein [Geminicoccaceae bacterium]